MIDFTPSADLNRPGYDDPGWLVVSVQDDRATLDRTAVPGSVLVGRFGYGVVVQPTQLRVYGFLSPRERLQKRVYAAFSTAVQVLNAPHYQPWPREEQG